MWLHGIALLALTGVVSCGHVRSAEVTTVAASYQQPAQPRSILVVTDRTADPTFASRHGEQVANVLRHFTPDTSWRYIDQLTPKDVADSGAVVYLGDNGAKELPAESLAAFRGAKYLVVTRYHVHQLHDAGIAFAHITEGQDVAASGVLSEQSPILNAQVRQSDYVQLAVSSPAKVLAALRVGSHQIPYIVQDGNATFINGTIDFDRLEARPNDFAQAVLVAQALNLALHVQPVEAVHFAMLRLEDVSVQTPATRLRSIVEYLAAEHVSYGIGVIPDQLIKGKTLSTLAQDPELVGVLRFAQAHGGTIILHGLHHSFNSPEDFEFWDSLHHRGLSQDSAPWMDAKITAGLQTERALGLNPRIWETPHYSASDLDYKEISKYFPVVWEQRRPNGWLPWPLKADAYGVNLLPENLGYVAYDGSTTVDDQLAIARLLLHCEGCIAAGFLHPSTVPLHVVRRFVTGMRSLGYQFADPASFTK